jgi:hypothetical protein
MRGKGFEFCLGKIIRIVESIDNGQKKTDINIMLLADIRNGLVLKPEVYTKSVDYWQ